MTSARDGTIERIHRDPPLYWRLSAPDDGEVYQQARRTHQAERGLVQRWLARRAPVPQDLDLVDGEGRTTSLDGAWHGLHYLLTGTGWGGAGPLALLAGTGREIRVEAGYGPPRSLSSREVQAAALALAQLGDEQLLARFDPAAMQALQIYPSAWEGNAPEDDPLGYLLEYAAVLRACLESSAAAGQGLIVELA